MNLYQKLLLGTHACYGLANSMAGLFLNLYLWKISQDLTVNASFNLATFFFCLFAFILGALLAKKKDRIFSFQIGVGLTALFYLLIVLLQENVAAFPMFIGVLNGMAMGFYWLGYLTLLYDLVDAPSRSAFMGKQNAIFGFVSTLGPAFAGLVISQFQFTGYNLVFGFSFLLFFIGLLLSFRLPKEESAIKEPFLLKLLWKYNLQKPILKPMWFGWFIFGMCEGLLIFFPTIILFMAVNNEFLVGISSILFGIVAVLSNLWHSAYNHQKREPATVLQIWVLYLIACILMIFYMNAWTVILFLIVNEMSKALLGVSYFSFMFRTIGDLPKTGLRIESMVMREIMLNGGRILSVLIFIFLYQVSEELTYYFFLLTIGLQGILYFIISSEKKNLLSRKKKIKLQGGF
ncbi:MFS transporter [Rossellomorea vietnamensis]|uniref:MFS transporter n=1 Tax=Rossellomorea vietnamensis TaxID=218284 RepID=UPI003CF226FB